jgi:hypothetical protein
MTKMSPHTIQSIKSWFILLVILAACAAVLAGCDSSAASAQPDPSATTADISSSATCVESETVREEAPRAAGADPFGSGPWYVNADRTIWVGWGSGPPWVKGENKKVVWLKPPGKSLVISGRRLDGDAEQLITQTGGYTSFGYEMTNLFFPTKGCWEITGKAGTTSFTFVTRVRG